MTRAGGGSFAVPDARRIIAIAKRENLAVRPDKYMKCLDVCYPIMERRKPPGSDINIFDFHKCMAAYMATVPCRQE